MANPGDLFRFHADRWQGTSPTGIHDGDLCIIRGHRGNMMHFTVLRTCEQDWWHPDWFNPDDPNWCWEKVGA